MASVRNRDVTSDKRHDDVTSECRNVDPTAVDVPRLDIHVDADDVETIKSLAMKIRPDWSSIKEIKMKDMSSGYINRNVACYHTTLDDGLFFRMLSQEGTLVDVQEALKVIDFLQTQRLCPQLRMVFENGFCMDFVTGDVLTWATRKRQYEPRIRKAVAQEMARYHSQKAYQVAEEYGIAEEYSFLSDDLIAPCWDYFRNDQNLDPSLVSDIPTLEDFQTERDLIEQMMTDAQLEKAFCHTDINPSNIIMTDEGARAIFVDYDFCRISYKAIDIAWFFLCFIDMMSPDFSEFPDDEYRDQWLREYLQAQWEVDGRQRPLTENKFNLLKYQTTVVHLWAILEFMYAMLFVVRVGPPPHATRNDILRGAKKCWDSYLSLRDDISNLTADTISSFSITEKTTKLDK